MRILFCPNLSFYDEEYITNVNLQLTEILCKNMCTVQWTYFCYLYGPGEKIDLNIVGLSNNNIVGLSNNFT